MTKREYNVKFGFKPHALQQDIINHVLGVKKNPKTGKRYRFFAATIGRQWGKSWTDKYLALEIAINQGGGVMWVAPALSGARDHWNDLVELVENSNLPVVSLNHTAKEIRFYSGGAIRIRSAVKPDNLRGGSLDLLIMDEAAFYLNGSYVWWSVLLPMITATGGVVLFTTTPNGRNWYYQLIQDATDKDNPLSAITKVWHFPSDTSPRQDTDLLAVLKTTMPSRKWREEFMAEFLADGGGVFFGTEKAAICEVLKAPLIGHSYVCGIDIGKNNDATCITFLDRYTRQQVYGERFTNMGTIKTVTRLIDLLHEWQPEVAHVEKNGVGEHLIGLMRAVMRGDAEDSILQLLDAPVLENNEETIGNVKLKIVHMTNELKRKYVERLAADIEYGRFNILSEDTKYGGTQLNEMSTYVAKRTRNAMSLSYEASSDDDHDDTIAALYLAYAGVPKVKPFKVLKKRSDIKNNPFRTAKGKRLKNA